MDSLLKDAIAARETALENAKLYIYTYSSIYVISETS